MKLAIPNLEPGDILDYFFNSDESGYSAASYDFSSFHFNLGKKYPIMKQRFDFTVDRGFYINFNAYNIDLKLQEGEAGTDAKGRVRATIKTYFFEDHDRDAIREEEWSYPLVDFPSVKFKVRYLVPKDKRLTNIIRGESTEVKATATPDEICAVAASRIRANSYRGSFLADETQKYLRLKNIDGSDPVLLSNAVYEQLRYSFVNKLFGNREGERSESDDLVAIKDEIFVNAMVTTLRRYDVGVEALVFTPRSLGKTKDILLSSEMSLACKVGDQIFLPYNNLSTPFDRYAYVQGVDAYSFVYAKNPRTLTPKEYKIEGQNHSDNVIVNSIEAEVDETLGSVVVKQKKTLKGNPRFDYAILLRGSNYFAADRAEFDPKYRGGLERGSVKAREEAERIASGRVAERVDELKKAMEDFTEERFGKIEGYGGLTLIADGRAIDAETTLAYSDEFTLTEKISKAGRNYLFDIGSLMGKQNSIDEKQKDQPRQGRIEVSYPLSVDYFINVTLPVGYTAEGLDALNIRLKSDVGEFISTVNMEGNAVKLEIHKKYLKYSMDKEDWEAFKNLINTSFDQSQKKIVIKKM